ncbi:MAG: two pore domain potassium channel family protein [Haliea sp.]|nr:two pore domain potassium channel family protein [Haliea sp.]
MDKGTPQALDITELIYFSFAALSTASFGDIAPALIQSRYLTILEMIVGVMYRHSYRAPDRRVSTGGQTLLTWNQTLVMAALPRVREIPLRC